MTSWCPRFVVFYVPIRTSPSVIHITLTQISSGATGKRTVHTTYIQQEIFQYLQPSNEASLGLIIPTTLPKEERGLENHITARFLIPRQYLEAFERDPERSVTPLHYIRS
jgi:hypothetical protein